MLADADQFADSLQSDSERRAFLRDNVNENHAFITRAPGRLDVMGGVGDYSGCLVAEATIAEAALVALSRRADRQIELWSVGVEDEGFSPRFSLSLNDFFDGGALKTLLDIRAFFSQNSKTRWAAYLAGCFYVLLAEGVVKDFPLGANILLKSRVPLGAGVSSSAAIEVATMQAVSVAFGVNLDGVTLARLAQKVENEVVGAPCGIMDQMTSALGVENSLLLILCQPHEVQGTQTWPDNIRFFGINSNVKHAVGGSAYTRARVAAFMGRKILAQPFGRPLHYLVDTDVSLYEEGNFQEFLPETISGREFLEAHGETGDTVTRIDSTAIYPVRAASEHAIYEQSRVEQFLNAIARQAYTTAGTIMHEAHNSYSRIGLGSKETDLLVNLAVDAGRDRGIYGAKITGGGSGGTVAFLTSGDDAEQTIHEIAAEYEKRTGRKPDIFEAGKSPGAMAFGHRQISLGESA